MSPAQANTSDLPILSAGVPAAESPTYMSEGPKPAAQHLEHLPSFVESEKMAGREDIEQAKSPEERDDATVVGDDGAVLSAKWGILREEANRAEEYEHSLGFWVAIKEYKAAVFWSFIASLSIVMEGYDGTWSGGINSMLQYRQYFGQYFPSINDYQVPASWQSGIGQAPAVGAFFGVFLGGWMNDRLGYKKSLLINYVAIIPLIAILVFAKNKVMLLMGGLLCGLPFGVFACLGAAYASEICPLSLRAYMTGWVNICWCLGGFVGNGVSVGTQKIHSEWAFRAPYATQWVWPIPLIAAMIFAPESPWWLVRHGRLEEAEKSVRRLGGKRGRGREHEIVANMVRTNQMEMDFAASESGASWLDIFRGTDLRRTEITVCTWVAQNMCGCIFMGNTVFVFEQAGISQNQAFALGLGTSAIQLTANFGNYALMGQMGRRTLYLIGFIYSDIILLATGIVAVYGDRGVGAAKWIQAGLQMAFMTGYTCLLGPVTYSIVGEASSTRLRNKTIAVGRAVYAVQGLVFNIINNYQINPSAWNWKGKTAFWWVPWCTLCLVWVYFRLPEFKNRSYYELDILFERRIPARRFKETHVQQNEEVQIKAEARGLA